MLYRSLDELEKKLRQPRKRRRLKVSGKGVKLLANIIRERRTNKKK